MGREPATMGWVNMIWNTEDVYDHMHARLHACLMMCIWSGYRRSECFLL